MANRPFSKEFALTATTTTQLALGLNANEALLVSSATAANNNGSIQTVTLYLASDGSAAGAGNLIEPKKAINPYSSTNTVLSGKTIYGNGKLYGGADTASNMTLSISGTIVPTN